MSSSYQVFARKYRPRTFDDILGQDHVVRTLKNAIAQNRLAHAYLFVGPRGTGKTSTARILAKALNCPGGPRADFDPDDPLCVEIAEGRSLDVLEIDGASNNGVEQVRELRENVKFAPTGGQFRIYYIDEVHMLTGAAFNALLKTLEEPPAHAKFIFATTEAHKVLPTIISRCQRFDLRRIPDQIIADHLLHIATQEKITLDPMAAHAIAKGAEGGMRDAQSMLDQLVAFCGETITQDEVLDIFGFTAHETIAGIAGAILNRDTVGALDALHAQSESGKDLTRLLGDLIGHFRSVLVRKVAPDAAGPEEVEEVAQTLAAQASQVSTDKLLTLIDVLADGDARMKWTPNKKLHFEIILIKATQTLGEASLSDVIAALAGAAPVFESESTPSPAAPATPTRTAPSPTAPSPTAPSPEPSSSPAAPAPPPLPAAGALSGEALWEATVQSFEKALLHPWLAAGTFLRTEGKTLVVGFHPDDATKRDHVNRKSAIAKIEGCLQSLAGSPGMGVRFDLTAAASPAETVVPEAGPGDDPGPDAPPTATEPDDGPGDNNGFYNDPLIKEAMEIFEAKIKPGS